MAADIIKPTFTIKVGDEEFEFRVPTPLERARIGAREGGIRRTLDPNVMAWDLDGETFCLVRGMAVLETLLERSNAKWPYSPDNKDVLRVDINNLPPGKEDVIMEVGRQFQEALDRFHGRGAGYQPAAVSEVVAGS